MVHVSDCCVGNGPEDSCFLVKIVSDVLVRPPRDEYDINDLGPQYFKLHGKQYKNALEMLFFLGTRKIHKN